MKVWVTRDEPLDGPLSTALRDVGLSVVNEPVIQRRVVYGAREEIESLGPEDWLVLTSPYAVKAIDPPRELRCRVAVVGLMTKRAAQERDIRVDHVSEGGTSRDLFEELSLHARGRTFCYPRSSEAREPELVEGITLVSPIAYEIIARDFRVGVVDEVDVISVASPSAVKAIGKLNKPFASIGPTTTETLREIGVEPWIEAPEKNFISLARAIADQV